MPALPTLFATQQASDLPLHEQLVRTLRSAMLAGHLPQHSRLPASRMLAADLGVSQLAPGSSPCLPCPPCLPPSKPAICRCTNSWSAP
ncbi:hypothetical protein ACSZNC_21575, partial [Aeromonas dhakensis]